MAEVKIFPVMQPTGRHDIGSISGAYIICVQEISWVELPEQLTHLIYEVAL